jgi:hypothetical protein
MLAKFKSVVLENDKGAAGFFLLTDRNLSK